MWEQIKLQGKNMTKYFKNVAIITSAVVIGFSGCSTKDSGSITDLQKQIQAKDAQISQLRNQNARALQSINAMNAADKDKNSVANSLVPPNAKPGECYAKVLVPAKYQTKMVKTMVKGPKESISVVPATYKWVTKTVVSKEASTKLITVPATYKTVTQRIMVSPESTKLVPVPATYKTLTQKIKVSEAHTTWKKGRGEIEKVNNSTGDIMCLVQVPAVYKTVTKRVIATPATTKVVKIPAVYKTVTRKVVATPATTKTVKVPAVYKTVKVKELVSQPKQYKKTTPAVYKLVPTKVKVSDSYLRWQEILCKTNTNKNVIARLQSALKAKNYITRIDGIYGSETRAAVRAYQRNNHLEEGALTLKTVKSLGL